jgi:hypothetical protein
MALLKNSRPMMLAQVMRVMKVSKMPAKMALTLAKETRKCMGVVSSFYANLVSIHIVPDINP